MDNLPKPKIFSQTEVREFRTSLILPNFIQPKDDNCSTSSSGTKRPPKLKYFATKRSLRDSTRSSVDEGDQIDKLNFSLDNLDDSAFGEN